MLTALCQEPWCFPPSVVAELTDHQILHHYLLPAAERARRMAEESRQGLPTAPPAAGSPQARANRSGPDGEPGSPVHRRQIVEMAFMGTMGMSREAAERLYDKQLQQWRDEQGG